MSNNKKETNENVSNQNGEKILFGVRNLVCFACGEKLPPNTKICPYCNTKINLK
jgi:uncharacterized OB-fold protein